MIAHRDIVKQIHSLEPLTPTASRLAGVVAGKESSINDIVAIIRYDQAITAQVLQWSNSALSAPGRAITSIKDAVIRLGGGRIVEYVIATHVKKGFVPALPAYGYGEMDLWRHSVAAATAAEQMAVVSQKEIDGLSFTASLLHDIGKLVLARIAPAQDLTEIRKIITEGRQTSEYAERTVLGFSHAEIGGEIAASWQLPPGIADAIRMHHALDGSGGVITDIVRVTNIVARSVGEGLGHEGMCDAVDEGLSTRMGLNREGFERLCALTAWKIKEVLLIFGI